MKLAYTLAAPEAKADRVLAWRAPLDQSFSTLAGLGYGGAELMIREPESFDAASTRRLAEQHGLRVVAVSTGPLALERGLNLSASGAAERAEAVRAAQAALDCCARLGAMMTIGAFRGPCEAGKEREATERLAESLGRIMPSAEALGVRVCLEPQNRFQSGYFRTVRETLPFIESIGGEHLGLSLDSFHMNIEENSFEEACGLAGRRTFHVQLADNHRGPPGTGMLDFKRLKQGLLSIEYNGWFSVEIAQKPSAQQAAAAAFEGCRQIFSEGTI